MEFINLLVFCFLQDLAHYLAVNKEKTHILLPLAFYSKAIQRVSTAQLSMSIYVRINRDSERLTKFLKSPVSSLVKTAKLRNADPTSGLSLFKHTSPSFSRAWVYWSSFSTWAIVKYTHTYTHHIYSTLWAMRFYWWFTKHIN